CVPHISAPTSHTSTTQPGGPSAWPLNRRQVLPSDRITGWLATMSSGSTLITAETTCPSGSFAPKRRSRAWAAMAPRLSAPPTAIDHHLDLFMGRSLIDGAIAAMGLVGARALHHTRVPDAKRMLRHSTY